MSRVIGIDFGTSNSAVAAAVDGNHQVLGDAREEPLTPSIVCFGKDDQILIGNDAKAMLYTQPKRSISSIKRLIGRKSFSGEVKKAKTVLPYEIGEDEEQNIHVVIGDKNYKPEEISALILGHMKHIAEETLKDEVKQAVITVPAYYNDNQRQATKNAAEIAGLEVLRMINEPTAAALAYGFGQGKDETVAIYDLGGGTFDISILRLKDKVFEVISTAGDTFLGGDDFDDVIVDLCANDFQKKFGIDLRTLPQALALLRTHAERAKRKLSYAEKTDIYIPEMLKKQDQTLDFRFSLSRLELRDATHDLIQKSFTVCDEALRGANMKARDLTAVILVGGSTKMSIIQEAVETYFGCSVYKDLNPDEVVAIGASIQASALAGEQAPEKKSLLLDVTPLDLGVATVGGYSETVIQQNTPIPTESTRVFTTTKDGQEVVDIKILQGRNRREDESVKLGEFEFSGFEKGRAGEATIEVTFAINTDGIVEVQAKDPVTNAERTVKVKLSATMNDSQIQASSQKLKKQKKIQLKDSKQDLKKVMLALTSQKPRYEEGFIETFDPKAKVLSLQSEVKNEKAREFKTEEINYALFLEDFNNIPRYLSALHRLPINQENSKHQVYEFIFKDGQKIYAQASEIKKNELGFWVLPYFSNALMKGNLYLFNHQLESHSPISA